VKDLARSAKSTNFSPLDIPPSSFPGFTAIFLSITAFSIFSPLADITVPLRSAAYIGATHPRAMHLLFLFFSSLR